MSSSIEQIEIHAAKVRALKNAHEPQTVVTAAIEELRSFIANYEEEIAKLKASKASQEDVKQAVQKLQKVLSSKSSSSSSSSSSNSNNNSTDYEGYILGAGNPLLDISAHVGQDLLDKYGLILNNASLAEAKDLPIFEELVAKYKVEYIAGGATLNSIRVAQWMLQEPAATNYIGCIGKDKFGKQLRECAARDGVTLHVLEDETTPTGTCAVLIKDTERSLCANLAAANNYKKEHFESKEIQQVVKKAHIVYSAGFFLTVSPETVISLARECSEQGRLFCINLSAPFIVQVFSEVLLKALEYCDFVFGNESECLAFGEKQAYGSKDVREISVKIAGLPKGNSRARVVVITQGAEPTIVTQGARSVLIPVPPLKKENIVDTNTAGDAFVGGVLAGLARNLGIEECVNAGHLAAAAILKVSGCTLKGSPPLNLKTIAEATLRVRSLKENRASQGEVKEAVAALVALSPRGIDVVQNEEKEGQQKGEQGKDKKEKGKDKGNHEKAEKGKEKGEQKKEKGEDQNQKEKDAGKEKNAEKGKGKEKEKEKAKDKEKGADQAKTEKPKEDKEKANVEKVGNTESGKGEKVGKSDKAEKGNAKKTEKDSNARKESEKGEKVNKKEEKDSKKERKQSEKEDKGKKDDKSKEKDNKKERTVSEKGDDKAKKDDQAKDKKDDKKDDKGRKSKESDQKKEQDSTSTAAASTNTKGATSTSEKSKLESAADKVRSLKASGAGQDQVADAIAQYLTLKNTGGLDPVAVATQKVLTLKRSEAETKLVQAAIDAYKSISSKSGGAASTHAAPSSSSASASASLAAVASSSTTAATASSTTAATSRNASAEPKSAPTKSNKIDTSTKHATKSEAKTNTSQQTPDLHKLAIFESENFDDFQARVAARPSAASQSYVSHTGISPPLAFSKSTSADANKSAPSKSLSVSSSVQSGNDQAKAKEADKRIEELTAIIDQHFKQSVDAAVLQKLRAENAALTSKNAALRKAAQDKGVDIKVSTSQPQQAAKGSASATEKTQSKSVNQSKSTPQPRVQETEQTSSEKAPAKSAASQKTLAFSNWQQKIAQQSSPFDVAKLGNEVGWPGEYWIGEAVKIIAHSSSRDELPQDTTSGVGRAIQFLLERFPLQ